MAKNPQAANTPATPAAAASLGFLAQLSTLATAITDLLAVAVRNGPLISASGKRAVNTSMR